MYIFCFISILPPAASAPTNLMAVQEGPTGIRVSWTPPTPLGDTTGYRIYYSGGSSGSVDVSGGSTDNHLLTGLQNGANYTRKHSTHSHAFSLKAGHSCYRQIENVELKYCSELVTIARVHATEVSTIIIRYYVRTAGENNYFIYVN